jgi:hypothetical protein
MTKEGLQLTVVEVVERSVYVGWRRMWVVESRRRNLEVADRT